MEIVTAKPTRQAIQRAGTTYAAEAVGTFFLVFTVGAGVASLSPLSLLAIGAALITMIYASGDINGAHYNPAVTLALLLRRWISFGEAIGHWLAQLVTGLVAATAVRAIVDPGQLAAAATMTLGGHALLAGFVVEQLITFSLCFAVLNAGARRDEQGNLFSGLATGLLTVTAVLAIGAYGIHIIAWPTVWVYLVAQIVGGIGTAVAFLALKNDDI